MARSRMTDSADERPLRLRARGDLEFYPQQFGARRYWVVKDPVALRYFQLRDEEYTILRMLDGRAGLREIVGRFQEKFAPRRLTEKGLHHFLGSLHSLGLIFSDRPGQAEPPLTRRREKRAKALRAAATNVLAIRLPGVDPDRFLRRVLPAVSWLFHPVCLGACFSLMIVALISVLLNPNSITARLPEMQAFFGPANLLGLAACLAAVKIMHELGHALACRHFGCECHEIGLLLLVFTPCLYCDITDSWTLTDKRKRMAITAAGIYVELLLASAATLLWWSTADGLLHALCLNVMFLCSVNTVLLNGNPLLRYDGYYLLSDWIEVPNLWQRSRAVLFDFASRILHGSGRESAVAEERPLLLACYGLASVVYRWLVVILILSFLYRVLRPMQLEVLAHLVTAITLTGMVVVPAARQIRSGLAPTADRAGQRGRRVVVAAALALTAILSFIPLPCRVRAPALLEAEQADRVYVTVPGRVIETGRVGDVVREGQTLAVLENSELAMEIVRLISERDQQAEHIKALEARRSHDPSAAAELPTARETLQGLGAQLDARHNEARRLELTAPREGTILPAPARAAEAARSNQLGYWGGLPTDECNLGAFFDTGTLLCSVGSPDRLRAVAYLNEKDIDLVRSGDEVRILLEQSRRVVLRGTVRHIAASRLEAVPPVLASLGVLPSVEEQGVSRPVETVYRVEVALHGPVADQLIGMRGNAKIAVRPRSIAQRLGRFVGYTFRGAR